MEKEKFLKQLGQAIRSRRESLNVTQEDFAYQHKLNRGNYGRIERGDANITIETLLQICDCLSVDPITLINEIDLNQ